MRSNSLSRVVLLALLILPGARAHAQAAPRDGSHDFDFEVGRWKVHLKRLLKPLSGSTEWREYEGTGETQLVYGGRSNVNVLTARNAQTGETIEGLTVRLYNPAKDEWSIYWSGGTSGVLALPPTVGRFTAGRGEFFDEEVWQGKAIRVRYVWSGITATSAHFEQAFSTDSGKTWEVNWIYSATRLP